MKPYAGYWEAMKAKEEAKHRLSCVRPDLDAEEIYAKAVEIANAKTLTGAYVTAEAVMGSWTTKAAKGEKLPFEQ